MNPHTASGIAVVTGAAGGMGAAIARKLHTDGHRVLLTDLDTVAVDALAAELSADGATARGIKLDVSRKLPSRRASRPVKTFGVPPLSSSTTPPSPARPI
ncbi:SDR family NAD(P)-dependent oxidoreductase [Rhodococcus sp. USK13]|uniref:SDR family NAD(P)-dependent oxidoreductase n=1 Tax=Rhodococcus sp. USK13 TaxID=2806442 RepID=UPI0024B5B9E3|nr:SDR family NAD(P)-dependent oxidoreductase [Rhodococcus sp. USK13]